MWRDLGVLLLKEVRLEWRSHARTNATLFFSLLIVLLFSFAAGPRHSLLSAQAPGYLWLALLIASVLGLGESMRLEAENDVLEGLRLAPVDPRALYLSKAIGNAAYLFLLGVFLVPVCIAVYGVEVEGQLSHLLLVILLGALAIAAPGTLLSAVAVQARARDVLLPLLLFPILVPGLLAAVQSTSLVFHGDPMQQYGSWVGLLALFDAVYWPVCAVLFERIVES